MSGSYAAKNGRIIQRGAGGRFRRGTLGDLGVPQSAVATGRMECADCGHRWRPILVTGYCPECGSQEKSTPTPEAR